MLYPWLGVFHFFAQSSSVAPWRKEASEKGFALGVPRTRKSRRSGSSSIGLTFCLRKPHARASEACFDTSLLALSPLLHRRLNVLVQVEEVCGIIPILESHQSFVVNAVRSSDAFITFVAQEVDIDTGAGKPSGGCPERTSPLHMFLRLVVGVGPRCEHAQNVRLLPLGKSRPGRMNSTCGTMYMLNQDLRKW